MSDNFFDFNDAKAQSTFDPIPKNIVVPVTMIFRPGGYDDPAQGWTGGYATRNDATGSIYLNVDYTILEGDYARRKVWDRIGLYSPKGPAWGEMGRSMILGMLNSAAGLSGKDESPQAQAKRRINGLGDLDGIEFLARIGVRPDQNGDPKNEIRLAVTPDDKEWGAYYAAGGTWKPKGTPGGPATTPASPSGGGNPPPASPGGTASDRPSWAR